MFTKGKNVQFMGRSHAIDHIVLSGGQLLVYLEGLDRPVLSDRIEITPTAFVLPEPARRF